MTINSINSNGVTPINITDSQKASKISSQSRSDATSVNAASTKTVGDTVSLTGAASQLRSLEQQLVNLPVVDVQRVDAVKREISNGSYEINPARIADKMIQMEMAINQRLV